MDNSNQYKRKIVNAGSNIVLPIDIQGITTNEKLPIERAPLTEYKIGRVLAPGESTYQNHTVSGDKLGIAIRFVDVADFQVEVAFVVPNTETYTLVPYSMLLDVLQEDNGGARIENISKYARIKTTNVGTVDAEIMTLSVVDF